MLQVTHNLTVHCEAYANCKAATVLCNFVWYQGLCTIICPEALSTGLCIEQGPNKCLVVDWSWLICPDLSGRHEHNHIWVKGQSVSSGWFSYIRYGFTFFSQHSYITKMPAKNTSFRYFFSTWVGAELLCTFFGEKIEILLVSIMSQLSIFMTLIL